MSRRFEPPVERPRYRIDGWLGALIQHRIAKYRELFSHRNAQYAFGNGPVTGSYGRHWVRSESLGSERGDE